MASDIYSALAASQTPQNLYFKRMLEEGTNSSPIQSPWQGVSRLAHALLAGMELRGQGDEEGKKFDTMFGLKPGAPVPVADAGATAAPPSPIANALAGPAPMAMGPDGNPVLGADAGIMPSPRQGTDNYSKAIAANESGGRYDALGPVIPKSGDRAYGKYQVMGANIPEWTRTHYGSELTPQQFVANKDAQEAVFKGQFGNYAQKYGPEGAARAWFAGEGGMNDPNRKDPLGTTVAQYGQRFNAGMGQGGPQTAQADPAALPPNATPTQGYAIPGQPQGQAQPGQRQAPQIPPDVLTRARAMWMSGDPTMKQAGIALLQPYLGPKDQEQPLTAPQDRARAGIPVTDNRPYQRNTVTNKVTPIDTSPTITMQANTTGETEYSKGKAQDALGLERSADKTMQERQQLQVFKSLVQDFKTGKLAPAQMTAGAWADAIGIDPKTMEKFGVPANAAVNGQLIESLSNQMTLGMIGTKGGEGGSMPANNFSDADRKFLQNTVPGLARQQGGNMVLAEIKQRGLDRQLDKISMWDDYRSQGKKFEEFERDWRAKVRSEPSLFADIPDMVRAQSAPAGGAAPAATQGAPSIDDLLKKYGPK